MKNKLWFFAIFLILGMILGVITFILISQGILFFGETEDDPNSITGSAVDGENQEEEIESPYAIIRIIDEDNG